MNRKINGLECQVSKHGDEQQYKQRNDSIRNLSKKIQQLKIDGERRSTH